MRVNHTGSLFRLGFLINTIQFMFQIPEAKLAKLKRSLESLILDGCPTYRELACLAGFVISLSLAVGPIARLFTREMYFFIQSRPSWDVSFTSSEALLQELKFWPQHIVSFNGYSIRGVFCANSTIYTDASDFAFGGYLATLGGEPVRGMFSLADVDMSFTSRGILCFEVIRQQFEASESKSFRWQHGRLSYSDGWQLQASFTADCCWHI